MSKRLCLCCKNYLCCKGPRGCPGKDGSRGPEGPIGQPGAVGADGQHGQPGADGQPGPTGAEGPPGSVGLLGLQGIMGPMGPTGPQGMNDTSTIKVFTGSLIDPGDEIDQLIYIQSSHRGSVVELTLLAHDLNSNTNYRYYYARTYWTRQWNNEPDKIDLITPIESGTGDPFDLEVSYYNSGNDIKIKLVHNISISTEVKYKIMVKILDLDSNISEPFV